jgi:fatty acid desaturase
VRQKTAEILHHVSHPVRDTSTRQDQRLLLEDLLCTGVGIILLQATFALAFTVAGGYLSEVFLLFLLFLLVIFAILLFFIVVL